jgi:predicted nucleotidyltransferase
MNQHIILKALVGSHLYGLENEDSDRDYLGIFMRPLEEILSFGDNNETYVYKNPDTTFHELKKFMWFAEKALSEIVCTDLTPGCGFDDEPGCQVCRWLRDESIKKGI